MHSPTATPAARRVGLPVGWHLAALAVGAVLPSLVLAGLLAARIVEEERKATDARLVDRARGLSLDIDLEMNATFRTLQALAESEHLDDQPDLARFREQALRVLRTQPSWRGLVLFDPTGRAQIHTDHPVPDERHNVRDGASFLILASTLRPTVGNLVRAEDGAWSFPLRVPVVRDNALRHVLCAVITPATIADILGRQPSSEEWTRSVIDSKDIVVARTRDPAGTVGTTSTPAFRERTARVRPGSGSLFPSTTLEGTPGYAAVHRSPLSGWATCVVLPGHALEAPVRRRAATLFVIALGVVLLGSGGAFLLGRRLSRAFASAAAGADALAHGGTPTIPASSVREVSDVRAALVRSAHLLRKREEERDQHLAQAEAARAEAEAANRVKDEFLAMLGHELRNPLAPMATALEVLRLRGEGTNSKEHVVLERQTQHLARLVDDLLDVSRITRGLLSLSRRPVRLAPIVACGVEMAAPLLEERRHALVVDLKPEDLSTLGDPARLAQVVGNLLTNAAKYTPHGGHIRVDGRLDGDEVVLSVQDDGQGIALDLLPRVFDLFVQGPRAFDRQEGGLGLGLSIVRSLITAHGGRIEARSEGPGRGSTFIIRLPATPPPEPTPATPGQRPGASASSVLVVDDNADAAEMLAELLRVEGHGVKIATDGPSALDAAGATSFDVAILDIGLPVMDGYELAARLRALETAPRTLIALTGYGQAKDVDRARAAGFHHHFVKPADLRRLLQVVAGQVEPGPAGAPISSPA